MERRGGTFPRNELKVLIKLVSALLHLQNDITEFVFLAVGASAHLIWPMGFGLV